MDRSYIVLKVLIANFEIKLKKKKKDYTQSVQFERVYGSFLDVLWNSE